jgi:hypothetical protein
LPHSVGPLVTKAAAADFDSPNQVTGTPALSAMNLFVGQTSKVALVSA